MNTCWICNIYANSREHKIKRSDLVRIFGDGSDFREAELNYRKHDGSIVVLQGPNSKHLKFDKVLCEKCNNERTQSFDIAYDSFIEYVDSNHELILGTRQIDFQKVYRNNWEESQLDLFRYFAKALGCRIADIGREVPLDMRELLFISPFQTMLWVCFAIDEDELIKPDKNQTLRIGNIITNEPNLSYAKFASSYRYKWLLISFWYGWGPFGPVGSKWCADSQFIYLGSYSESLAKPLLSNGKDEFQWPGL